MVGFRSLTRKFVAGVNRILIYNNQQNIYTRKKLVMMETTIYNFHTSFYIPENQKLAFDIPHVQIMDTNHSVESRQTAFKHRESFQDVLY